MQLQLDLTPAPSSFEKAWKIAAQGLHSKNLFLDISPNADGFVISVKTPHDSYRVYFSPFGQITHVRHSCDVPRDSVGVS